MASFASIMGSSFITSLVVVIMIMMTQHHNHLLASAASITFTQDDFKITGNDIEYTNKHLTVPNLSNKLRVTIRGTTMTNITADTTFKNNRNVWTIGLSDQKSVMYVEASSETISKKIGKGNVTEFIFEWPIDTPTGTNKEVCFHYGLDNIAWYGTFEERDQSFPLNVKKSLPKLTSWTTGDAIDTEFGSIVEGMFVTSNGFAIKIDRSHPLFVRRDTTTNASDPLLCFASVHQMPYIGKLGHDNFYIGVRFLVMAGGNIAEVYQEGVDESYLPIFASTRQLPDEMMFGAPIWTPWIPATAGGVMSQQTVLDFVTTLEKNSYNVSNLELPYEWQKYSGDYVFDKQKFPNAKEMIDKLHQQKCRVSLRLATYFESNSATLGDARNRKFVVNNLANTVPVTLSWPVETQTTATKSISGNALDVSIPLAKQWLYDRLKALSHDTGVDSYTFGFGELHRYGTDFRFNFSVAQQFPNTIVQHYNFATYWYGKMAQVSARYQTQDLILWYRLFSNKNGKWTLQQALDALLPTTLTVSLAGYHFIVPEMVTIGGTTLPSEETYIRWIQAVTFFPAMHIAIPPWAFGKDNVAKITATYVALHEQYQARMVELAQNSTNVEPLLRPMWYVAPDDTRAFTINDQYMVGDELLVAPITKIGQTQRDVYVPSGKWINRIDGKTVQGPVVVKVTVPLDKLAYFERQV